LAYKKYIFIYPLAFVSATCNKPDWFYSLTGQRYYSNSGRWHFSFANSKSGCSSRGAQLAVIIDSDTHNSVHSRGGHLRIFYENFKVQIFAIVIICYWV